MRLITIMVIIISTSIISIISTIIIMVNIFNAHRVGIRAWQPRIASLSMGEGRAVGELLCGPGDAVKFASQYV